MDAPYRSNFADLAALANNRATWKPLVEVKFGKNKCKKEKPRNSDVQNSTAHILKTARPKTSKTSLHSAPRRERAMGRWLGSGVDAVWIGPDPEPQCRDVDPIRRTTNVAAGTLTITHVVIHTVLHDAKKLGHDRNDTYDKINYRIKTYIHYTYQIVGLPVTVHVRGFCNVI